MNTQLLAPLTTTGVGGPAGSFVRADTEEADHRRGRRGGRGWDASC